MHIYFYITCVLCIKNSIEVPIDDIYEYNIDFVIYNNEENKNDIVRAPAVGCYKIL